MGTIADKLTYLNGTKQAIKEAINEDFEVINDNTTFRQYAEKISNNNEKYKSLIPTKTVNATNTVDISDGAGMKALVNQYGNTYQKSTTGKNLLNGTIGFNQISKYLAEYTKTDKDITVTTSSTNQYAGVTVVSIPIENGNTYTVSMKATYDTNGMPNFRLGKNNNEVVNIITTGTRELKEGYYLLQATFTANSDFSLAISIYPSYISNNTETHTSTFYDLQIENGSVATDYEEYTGGTASPSPDYPQDIVNISGETTINITQGTEEKEYKLDLPFELCKRGDYQDKLYNQNGKWYLYKEIGKVVYDGSENWTYYDHYLQTSLTGGIDWTGSVAPQGLCDKYICRSRYYIINTTFKKDKSISLGASFLALYDSNFTDVTSFKTWLSTHNIIVYYQLATSTTEEITESNYPTLYNQLNAIKLFEGTNHITVTNESGLDVEFDIEYYKDWKLD